MPVRRPPEQAAHLDAVRAFRDLAKLAGFQHLAQRGHPAVGAIEIMC